MGGVRVAERKIRPSLKAFYATREELNKAEAKL
jgi:hypothetical protein